jgi:Holliday junction resolvase RusA-like endonuclease
MKQEKIQFFVPMRPKGKARARVTKWGAYTPKTTVEAEQEFIKEANPFVPEMRILSAVSVVLTFYMPCQAHMSKKNKQTLQYKPHTVKPDIDNLVKLVLDAMTKAGFWKDDSQVVILKAEKRWAGNEECGISVEVKRVR